MNETTRNISLVARREAMIVLRSRGFAISTLVTLVIVVGGFALTRLFDDGPDRIGLQGAQPPGASAGLVTLGDSLGDEFEIVDVAPGRDPATALDDDDLAAVVVDGTQIVLSEYDDRLVGVITSAWQEARLADDLQAAGVDGAILAQARAPLTISETDPEPDAERQDGAGFATVLILFLAIQAAGAYIMMSVMQEKGTRIVELILSSIPARDLLLGKVIGIGVVGLVQVVTLVGSFLLAAVVTGQDLPRITVGAVAAGVAFYLAGYLFYGSLFAAGASLAPSQEDAQATLAPISILTVASYFGSVLAATNPDSALSQVVSYLPPVAPFAFPGLLAAGDASLAETALALVITLIATAVVFTIAARVYVRSVVHTDRRIGWREAWSLRA